jgi:hypothetical protein
MVSQYSIAAPLCSDRDIGLVKLFLVYPCDLQHGGSFINQAVNPFAWVGWL